ncbi:MaoC family dehydratase [Rhodococcus sp. IEGM 1318]|uniref:MaoC family dehydratase n=1 Tax=Rhodococcus sp. IEGM 1318 TaxID=3082226 RepID=UPI0029536689|nr:MaoC family dehydratase [Rhodococcus sp. IEGM 1318]MDV8009368.1 MaoC family dehydratase [Rhodococcus sp. IEGM 1318]
MTVSLIGGPYFDQLTVGTVYDSAPAVTLTDGLAAVHQSILGNRLRLPLDTHLSKSVTGEQTALAHPGLVCDVAIGQSTLATHHVIANLFYRGLRFHRFPHIGETLHTRTEVVALRENSNKTGRALSGLAALHVTSTDRRGEVILDFYRCALLPLSDNPNPGRVRHSDDMSSIGPRDDRPWSIPQGWDLDAYRKETGSRTFVAPTPGMIHRSSGDVVSNAPELARLSMNIAAVHHDQREQGSRLVYGGHTIGLALGQANRAFPDMIGILGWVSCDHTGPVREGDTLTSDVTVESVDERANGIVVQLRSVVRAQRADGSDSNVLDWRFVAVMP